MKNLVIGFKLSSAVRVEVRVLMQAVKRNLDRFPADFMFQLNNEEWQFLKSQSVISSWGGARTAPYAFTEQGVAMLSSLLKSGRAIQVNIEIMRAFARLRWLFSEHQELAGRLDHLEQRYDQQFKAVFDAIRQLMAAPEPSSRPIGFTADLDKKRDPS